MLHRQCEACPRGKVKEFRKLLAWRRGYARGFRCFKMTTSAAIVFPDASGAPPISAADIEYARATVRDGKRVLIISTRGFGLIVADTPGNRAALAGAPVELVDEHLEVSDPVDTARPSETISPADGHKR